MIISNAMFRIVLEQQRTDLQANETFSQQEKEIIKLLESSEISKTSSAVRLGQNTILPYR